MISFNHILCRSRRLLQSSTQGRISAEGSGCIGFRFCEGVPLLSEGHAGILSGSDNRAILAKHMSSFAPVAQHQLFGKKDFPLDISMERNFPWQYVGSPPAEKILTCLFPFLMDLPNLCLPLNTDTTTPKLEKASLIAWPLVKSGRRIVTKIGSLPILRAPTRLRKFLLRRF